MYPNNNVEIGSPFRLQSDLPIRSRDHLLRLEARRSILDSFLLFAGAVGVPTATRCDFVSGMLHELPPSSWRPLEHGMVAYLLEREERSILMM